MALRYAVYDTLAGNVTIIADDKGIVSLLFGSFDPVGALNEENLYIYDAIMEVNRYWYGQLKKFTVKIRPHPVDELEAAFQQYCLSIPYGETREWKDVAEALNCSIEKVQQMCSSNKLPLFIPCHRITGPSGGLSSYCASIQIQGKAIQMEKDVLNGTYVPSELTF